MPSLSGRVANLMSKRFPGLGRRAMHRQIEQFRASKGTKGDTLFAKPVFLLDVVGRNFASYREPTDRRIPVAVLSRKG